LPQALHDLSARTAAIRPFSESDLEAVVTLWNACGLTRPWNPPARDIAFCRSSGHGAVFVAELDGRVVGTVMAGHDGHRGWLYYLAVDPDRRRQRLAGALVTHAEAWLVAQGVPKVMLLIRETNTAVAGFYERAGYAAEARLVMSKWLKSPPPSAG
jgi:ribosomal protein S18 acetylase RimI-like enzyme